MNQAGIIILLGLLISGCKTTSSQLAQVPEGKVVKMVLVEKFSSLAECPPCRQFQPIFEGLRTKYGVTIPTDIKTPANVKEVKSYRNSSRTIRFDEYEVASFSSPEWAAFKKTYFLPWVPVVRVYVQYSDGSYMEFDQHIVDRQTRRQAIAGNGKKFIFQDYFHAAEQINSPTYGHDSQVIAQSITELLALASSEKDSPKKQSKGDFVLEPSSFGETETKYSIVAVEDGVVSLVECSGTSCLPYTPDSPVLVEGFASGFMSQHKVGIAEHLSLERKRQIADEIGVSYSQMGIK